jgi:hypothetical protein
VFEVHSEPMMAVNRPGPLYCLAAAMVSCQADLNAGMSGEYTSGFGSVPCEKTWMISVAAWAPCPLLRNYVNAIT